MFLGALLQGVVGFGMNLVAAPVLILVDHAFLPGPAIAAGLVISLLTTVSHHQHIVLGELRWAVAGRLPGTVIGAVTVSILSGGSLSILLAVLVLVAVALSVGGLDVEPTAPTLVTAGVLSGFMGTVTSIGGPPVAMLYQRSAGPQIRAMLGGLFLVGSTMSIVALIAVGHFGFDEVRMTAALIPGILAGFVVARPIGARIDGARLRSLVLIVAALSAVSVLASESL
jgi:uncharacterized membrane protein YfcA